MGRRLRGRARHSLLWIQLPNTDSQHLSRSIGGHHSSIASGVPTYAIFISEPMRWDTYKATVVRPLDIFIVLPHYRNRALLVDSDDEAYAEDYAQVQLEVIIIVLLKEERHRYFHSKISTQSKPPLSSIHLLSRSQRLLASFGATGR